MYICIFVYVYIVKVSFCIDADVWMCRYKRMHMHVDMYTMHVVSRSVFKPAFSPPELQLIVDRSAKLARACTSTPGRAGGFIKLHDITIKHVCSCCLAKRVQASFFSSGAAADCGSLCKVSKSLYVHSTTTSGHQQSRSHLGFAVALVTESS